jgi:histidinol-phosphate aminotransferase
LLKFKKNVEKAKRSSNIEDRSHYILRLDRNEKIIPFNNQYKRKLNKYINNIDLNLYPNLKSTYVKLSKFIRINNKNILITEGVSGAIKNILDSISINKKTEIVVPNPSFALYKIYSEIYGLRLKTYNYDNNFNLKLNSIFKLISKNTSIVFLTFPNIPVEGNTNLKFIKKLVKFLEKKKILLVIDEVYFPFNKSSALSLINRFKNLVVMKSFSKAFGLAGARIGYMVSEKKNIKIFSNTKGGYETNMLSAMAMNFVIDNYGLTKKYTKDVAKGFLFLKKKLDYLKIKYYGGNNSNFIFINFDKEILSKKIYKRLKQNKIAVRWGYPKPFNKGILLTGCPLKEMKKFFFIFEKIYK